LFLVWFEKNRVKREVAFFEKCDIKIS